MTAVPILPAGAGPADAGEAELLLVAYQCGPGLGSVSQLGWQWFTGLAARRAVCLVTHVRNRDAIESAPDKPAAARVIYIDTEWFAGPLYRLARRLFPRSEHAVFMLSQLDWFVFDAVALRRLRRERQAGAAWRLLHLVTPVTVSAPTRLHRLGLPVGSAVTLGIRPRAFELVAANDPHYSWIDICEVTAISGCTFEVCSDATSFLLANVDVAIDFTHLEAARANLEFCADNGIHDVVGTSGFTESDFESIAARFVSSNCLIAPNFAIGAVLMMRFAELAAPYFDTAEIIELHHDSKVDGPSFVAEPSGGKVDKSAGKSSACTPAYQVAMSRHAGPSSPSSSQQRSRSRAMTPQVPSSAGCALSMGASRKTSPCAARSSDVSAGLCFANGKKAAPTSCTKPGRVFALLRHAPPGSACASSTSTAFPALAR